MSNENTFDPAEFCETHGLPLTDLERYPLDGCARTRRGGDIDYPYAGCSVWLLPDTPMSLASAAMDLRVMSSDEAAGRAAFAKLTDGLSRVVAGHDIPGYSQWYGAPTAVEEAPTTLMFYVFQTVINGEVPAERPNASGAGQTGGSIRRRTGKTTLR
jgi:hypothetical protein